MSRSQVKRFECCCTDEEKEKSGCSWFNRFPNYKDESDNSINFRSSGKDKSKYKSWKLDENKDFAYDDKYKEFGDGC